MDQNTEIEQVKTHVMRIADRTGDTLVQWRPDNAIEAQKAAEQFEALIQQHYQAFQFLKAGAPGEVVAAFNPLAEKFVLMPQAVGG